MAQVQITTDHRAVTQGVARTGLEVTAIGHNRVTQELDDAVAALAGISMQQHIELIHCGIDVGRCPQ